MIDAKHRITPTHSARQLVYCMAILGVAFMVVDMPAVDAIAVIAAVGAVIIASAIAAYIGYSIGQDDTDIFTSSSGGSDWDNTVLTDYEYYNNFLNQSDVNMQNSGQFVDASFLYYGRRAENEIPNWLSEPVWNVDIENNITLDLMLNYTEFVRVNIKNMQFILDRMVARDNEYDLDGSCPIDTTMHLYHHGGWHDNTVFYPGEIKIGNVIRAGAGWWEIWNIGDIYLTSTSDIASLAYDVEWVNIITGEQGNISGDLGVDGLDYQTVSDLEPSLYKFRVNSGTAVFSGAIPKIQSASTAYYGVIMRPGVNDFGGYPFDLITNNDYINIRNSVTFTARQIVLGQYTDTFNLFLPRVHTLRAGVIGLAHGQYDTYKLAGYDSAAEVPENEIIPPMDLLWYDINQMTDFDYDQLYMMWLVYLAQLDDTPYNITIEDLTPYDFNFTDAGKIVNGSVLRYERYYNAAGVLIDNNYTKTLIDNSSFIIVPLQDTLTLNTTDNKTVNQSIYVYDIEAKQLYNLPYDATARVSKSFNDTVIDVYGLKVDGVNTTEFAYEITTIGDFVEQEYEITPFVSTLPAAALDYWFYGGITILVIGFITAFPEATRGIAPWVIGAGIIVLAAWGLYTYVFPAVWDFLPAFIQDWFT